MISAGENEYFAQYSSSEVWGKWSPNEELVFLEETDPLAVASAPQEYEDETVSMLGAGAILGPGLGLGGAAVAGLAGASILTGGSGGGAGEVISSSRPQIIQNLEGGILADLNVVEGDVVSQGDILARLHDTKFQSSVDELRDQIAALEIRRLRIEAEMAGENEFSVKPEHLARSPDIVASEMALLRARQLDFSSRRQGAQRILEQAQAETELLENMLKKKVVALIEVTRARKVLADAQVKLDEILTHSELELANEYSDTLKELATLRQNLRAYQDQLNRTVLQSPMRGVVNNVSVTTIGGVVRPGEEILQIIPLDEELFVEARVKPENIANIRPGQEATIKLSAYDYTIFGTLKGRVDVISADTFKDERTRAEDGNAHYKVRVRVDMGD